MDLAHRRKNRNPGRQPPLRPPPLGPQTLPDRRDRPPGRGPVIGLAGPTIEVPGGCEAMLNPGGVPAADQSLWEGAGWQTAAALPATAPSRDRTAQAKGISDMGLASFLSGHRRSDVADLAIQIAVLSHQTVVELTLDRARQLTHGEARGYIRARSRETITRQAELIFRRHAELKPAEKDQILSLALDQIVYLMMRDLVHTATATRRKVA